MPIFEFRAKLGGRQRRKGGSYNAHSRKDPPKTNKNSPVVPQFTMENMRPMDHLGMEKAKYRGIRYTVIADTSSGYC